MGRYGASADVVRHLVQLHPGARDLRDRRGLKLDRARSRLYRGQILQQNMRLKALAEIYTMHSFAHLSNLNLFLSQFCQHFETFRKI